MCFRKSVTSSYNADAFIIAEPEKLRPEIDVIFSYLSLSLIKHFLNRNKVFIYIFIQMGILNCHEDH